MASYTDRNGSSTLASWPAGDTLDPDAQSNRDETYVLFRSVAPVRDAPPGTALEDAPPVLWLRTYFTRLPCFTDSP